jgi:hypothetical protein
VILLSAGTQAARTRVLHTAALNKPLNFIAFPPAGLSIFVGRCPQTVLLTSLASRSNPHEAKNSMISNNYQMGQLPI